MTRELQLPTWNLWFDPPRNPTQQLPDMEQMLFQEATSAGQNIYNTYVFFQLVQGDNEWCLRLLSDLMSSARGELQINKSSAGKLELIFVKHEILLI